MRLAVHTVAINWVSALKILHSINQFFLYVTISYSLFNGTVSGSSATFTGFLYQLD